MIFIDYFKLFAFCALSLVVCTEARSVSQFGDIRIIQEDDKWICDKIECPKDTYRCYVSKSNEEDPAVLVRTNICYAQDNTSLAESVTSTSVDPKNKIRVQLNSYKDGLTTTSDFNVEEFEKNLQKEKEEMNKNMQKEMEEMNKNMQKEMEEMQHDLEHMFD